MITNINKFKIPGITAAAVLILLMNLTLVHGSGTTAAMFLEISPSARASAMGNAYTSISDITGMSANPAGLAFLKHKEVAISFCQLYQENKLSFITGALPLKEKYVIGLNILTFNTDPEPIYDWSGAQTDQEITYKGSAFGATGAMMLTDKLAIGINAKSIDEEIIDYKDSAFATDSGIIYRHELNNGTLQIGAALNNMGGEIRVEDRLPQAMRFGGAYIHKGYLTLTGEFYNSLKGGYQMIRAGGEYWINDAIAPRAGLTTRSDLDLEISFGFGAKFNSFYLDYAASPSGPLGISHRVAIGMKLGYVQKKAPKKEKPENEAKPRKEVIEKPRPVIKRAAPGELLNVAVAELEGKNVSAMDAAIVSDFIRTELVKTQSFNVLDRQNMERLLEEQSFQMTGCTNEECAVQMGKVLNVKYMIVGSFSKFLDTYYINANLVDVETGQIVGGESEECATGKELPVAAKKISEKFAEQFGSE
ncbi:MAG: PorV/PorQ family protein [Elusimicrobiota bacterium]